MRFMGFFLPPSRTPDEVSVSRKPSATIDGMARSPDWPGPSESMTSSMRSMYAAALPMRSQAFFWRPWRISASTASGTSRSGAASSKRGTGAETCIRSRPPMSSQSKGGTPVIISYIMTESE